MSDAQDEIMRKTNEALLETARGIKFNIIYIDPPYDFTMQIRTETNGYGTVKSHYQSLTVEQLKQLKIQNLCNRDCALFIWSSGALLKNTLELIEAWGFKYKTVYMNWIKTYNGMVNRGRHLGYYTLQAIFLFIFF